MTQLILPKTIMIDGKWVSDVMHIATRGPKGWSDRPAKKDEAK